MDEAKLLFAGQ